MWVRKPDPDEVRWRLFDRDELEEMRVGLVMLHDGGSRTTEGDILQEQIVEEQKRREIEE